MTRWSPQRNSALLIPRVACRFSLWASRSCIGTISIQSIIPYPHAPWRANNPPAFQRGPTWRMNEYSYQPITNQWTNGVFTSATRDDVQNRLLVPIAWHQSGYRLFDFYFSWLAALWFENLKIATIATEDGKHQFVLSIFMILIDIHWPPWLFGERGLMLTLTSLKEQCCPFRSFGSGVVESLGLAVELIW